MITANNMTEMIDTFGCEYVLNKVSEQYRKQYEDEVDKKYKQKFKSRLLDFFDDKSEALSVIVIVLGVLTLLTVIASPVVYFDNKSNEYSRAQINDCMKGNKGACVEAIKDCSGGYGSTALQSQFDKLNK